jgi:NAD(P)-dependent dehydrogenase (short-subunit alcohol dehydrogenase family)
MSALPRTPSFRLDGRRAIVTGASRGIGFASAVALAEAGAEVTLVARSHDELEARAAEIRAAFGTARALPLDVADIQAVERELVRVGPFDILVNNAGVSRHRPMLETRAEDFDYVLSINLRAAYFVAKAVAAGMVEAGRPGAIIHISSQMGHVGGIDRTVYSASKHAIEGLTKSMAIELGPHRVRVNSIAPTFIKTPLTDSTFADPARRAWIESKIKLGRIGELEDIMGAVVFLASDAAAMITGTSLLIDGGWTAG